LPARGADAILPVVIRQNMITTLAILVSSAGLFLYWFRSTCLLILRAQTKRDYAEQTAAANDLQFVHFRRQVEAGIPADMDRIRAALQQDYEIVTFLVKHASEFNASGDALEALMLELDYRIMGVVYSVAKVVSPNRARAALGEICAIVHYFANTVGERAACRRAAAA
jgi:hypothetical protein